MAARLFGFLIKAADGQRQCLPPDSLILQCARRSRKAKVGMGGMIFEKMADTERYFPQSSKADGG